MTSRRPSKPTTLRDVNYSPVKDAVPARTAAAGASLPLGDPSSPEECARLVIQVAPRAVRQIRSVARLHASGLTVPQFRALAFVRRHPDEGLTLLSEHLGVSLPAASALISRLVKAELVARTTNPAERRRILLVLTPAGLERLAESQAAVSAWWRERLAALRPADRIAIARAMELLDTLLVPAADPRTEERRA